MFDKPTKEKNKINFTTCIYQNLWYNVYIVNTKPLKKQSKFKVQYLKRSESWLEIY